MSYMNLLIISMHTCWTKALLLLVICFLKEIESDLSPFKLKNFKIIYATQYIFPKELPQWIKNSTVPMSWTSQTLAAPANFAYLNCFWNLQTYIFVSWHNDKASAPWLQVIASSQPIRLELTISEKPILSTILDSALMVCESLPSPSPQTARTSLS